MQKSTDSPSTDLQTDILKNPEFYKDFFMDYITKLVDMYPHLEKETDELIRIFTASTGVRYQEYYNISKNEGTKIFKQLTKDLPMKKGLVKRGYREQFLGLLDIRGAEFNRDLERYAAAKKSEHPHTKAERPTKADVVSLVETVAPTDVNLKQALWDMLPMLRDDDWEIIDIYRTTVRS